jgi:hypothetical protein
MDGVPEEIGLLRRKFVEVESSPGWTPDVDVDNRLLEIVVVVDEGDFYSFVL